MIPPSPVCEPTTPPPAESHRHQLELWQRYHAAGPGDATEEELVKKYLPLVRSVVGRLAMSLPPHVDGEDLYSSGLVGLLNAVRHYNPKLGTSFEPYARLRIRGAILDELRRMDWVPRAVHTKARKVQRAMDGLEQSKGIIPSDADMAAALKISLAEYHQWLEEIRPATFICLDSAQGNEGDGESSEHEAVANSDQEGPVEAVSRRELARLIAERMQQLPGLHQKVLALYYFEELRLREISAVVGLCESRICQIHTQAILAIKSFVEKYESNAPGLKNGASA